MKVDVTWVWHPAYQNDDYHAGWWQAVVVTHDPLRWQFVALVGFEEGA